MCVYLVLEVIVLLEEVLRLLAEVVELRRRHSESGNKVYVCVCGGGGGVVVKLRERHWESVYKNLIS
jgi:hypothetical protein